MYIYIYTYIYIYIYIYMAILKKPRLTGGFISGGVTGGYRDPPPRMLPASCLQRPPSVRLWDEKIGLLACLQ